MPLAQVIRIDERLTADRRPTFRHESGSACVVLQLFRSPAHAYDAGVPAAAHDVDRVAGRGRDPG